MTYVSNNKELITTDVASFMIEQRNVGFDPNDGQWIATQLGECEFNYPRGGVLYWTRRGKFLGVFASRADVDRAIQEAKVQPAVDEPVGATVRHVDSVNARAVA